MQGGVGPVYVHEIAHALAASYAGTRPRPIREGESRMLPVPVVVLMKSEGERIAIAPCEWHLLPHVAANSDPDRHTADGSGLVPVGPERHARLVFVVRVPPGYRLVKDAIESPPATESAPTEEPEGPREIPEFAGVDPAVFAYSPEGINAALRRIYSLNPNKPGSQYEDGPKAKPTDGPAANVQVEQRE